MNTIKKVPVVILNGFLGSGKTTLFRNLMAQAKKNDISICAIVNDMSELDVDGELLGNTDVVEDNSSILESIHSCVLSSQQGLEKMDLALHRLLSQHDPEIVVIETSGSCHPMPLIEYFKAHEDTELVGVFALVDSLMLTHDYQEGQELIPKLQYNLSNGIRDTTNLLIEQIMFCSHLFLTKSDRIPEGRLEHIASHIQAINPFASAHSVQFGRLQIESLFELEEYNYHQVAQLVDELKPILEADEQADRPYDLATRVIKDERPFHPQRLWEICHEYLDQRIYRSKGFFWLASRDRHSMLWNQAAGGINLEIIGSWRAGILEDENHGLSSMEYDQLKALMEEEKGRFGDRHCDLTVIGDVSQVDRFTDALKSCFLTEEEIKLWQEGQEFEDPWPRNIVRMTR